MAKWRKIILEGLPQFKHLLCDPDKEYPNNIWSLVSEMLCLYEDSVARRDIAMVRAVMNVMEQLLELPDRNIYDAVLSSFSEHLMDCIKTEEDKKILAHCVTTNVLKSYKDSYGCKREK